MSGAMPAEYPDERPNAMTIDQAAIEHNTRWLRHQVGPDATFVAALKANAYGFGLVPVARVVLAAGADIIALVDIDDAIELRGAGISAPILMYGGTTPSARVVGEVARHDLTVTVLDAAGAAAFARAPSPLQVMVKIDVGLERLGVDPAGALDLVRIIDATPGLVFRGCYTHLHAPRGSAQSIADYIWWQFGRFREALAAIEAAGIRVPLRVAASSGPLRLTGAMALGGIDVGTLLFGLDPPGPAGRDLGIRPALVSVSSRLTQVRTIDRREFPELAAIPTGRPVRLGVIPFGTANGLASVSVGHALVAGRRAPILSISLEHTRLDLTGIDAVAGDEVVLIGAQGDERITLADVAAANDLPSTAVVPVLLGRGVERRYLTGPA